MCSMQYNAKVCMDDVFETACHSISNVSLEILDAVIHSTLTMFDISEMVCSVICSSYLCGDAYGLLLIFSQKCWMFVSVMKTIATTLELCAGITTVAIPKLM